MSHSDSDLDDKMRANVGLDGKAEVGERKSDEKNVSTKPSLIKLSKYRSQQHRCFV